MKPPSTRHHFHLACPKSQRSNSRQPDWWQEKGEGTPFYLGLTFWTSEWGRRLLLEMKCNPRWPPLTGSPNSTPNPLVWLISIFDWPNLSSLLFLRRGPNHFPQRTIETYVHETKTPKSRRMRDMQCVKDKEDQVLTLSTSEQMRYWFCFLPKRDWISIWALHVQSGCQNMTCLQRSKHLSKWKSQSKSLFITFDLWVSNAWITKG